MLRVRPFQGLRPADDLVDWVASVPYDQVDAREAAALVNDNPFSMLHVDRAEIDLPADTDPASPVVYERAVETFKAYEAQEILVRESEPCVYLYRQTMGDHVQTGIALTCHIGDYENGVITKHEETRPDEEADRARLISALSANTSPVVLSYPDSPDLDLLTAEVIKGAPHYDFVASDGVRHTVWRLPGERLAEFFVNAFARVPNSDIVGGQGHHLAASAVRIGCERRAANPNHTGDESYNWFLCVLFPASQLAGERASLAPKLRSGLFIHTF